MPSVVIGQPAASGAQLIISGNPWSGHLVPYSYLQLRWVSSGGNVYVAFSGFGPPLSGGFMTINSGAMILSGGAASGMLDGLLISPGDCYSIPAAAITNKGATSGAFNLVANCDVQASGVGRLYFEML